MIVVEDPSNPQIENISIKEMFNLKFGNNKITIKAKIPKDDEGRIKKGFYSGKLIFKAKETLDRYYIKFTFTINRN